ncbi:hypothetical protein [Flavobacterium sp. 7A]|uniref:hypothetical protein n=1 Tax=Flavobacterium sp. 7A TaxID=2940571 RepID=UPI0022271946|nr:hypothetical protein [Flavobacterium sp. 7A]MCW2118183.1 hypothetical protein [Flavobacterium sp. 7A]
MGEVVVGFIAIVFKFIFRVFFILVAVPFGVFFVFLKFFPEFSGTADFWFFSSFFAILVLGYALLWRPIIWITGLSTILEIENS